MGKMTKGVMFEESLPAKCRLVQWKPVLSWNPVSSHFHYVCLLSLWPVYWSVNARKISSIKKKKGTFSEMLDNSRGIVLRNLSHTLLKKKTKNTMTEFTSSRELYYPKHSWSNSLHLLWTLYFPPHASSNWTRAHRSTVTAQTELQGRKQAGVREPWENNQCWQKHESKHRVVCRHHRCFEREMWY